MDIERHEFEELDKYCLKIQAAINGLAPEDQYQVLEHVKNLLLKDCYDAMNELQNI